MLVRAGLLSDEEIANAANSQSLSGRALGEHLPAPADTEPEVTDPHQNRAPREPASLAHTGIDSTDLLLLLLKLIHIERLYTVAQFSNAIKLPPHLVAELVRTAVERHLLQSNGSPDSKFANIRYALTDDGKREALDALQITRYTGPAPVPLDDFTQQIARQKLNNEVITPQRIREALADLVVDERLVEQSGPAMTSCRAILLYGPPGNGKTSVAVRLATVFEEVIFVPHAISIDGQIIRVFDMAVHEPVEHDLPVREDDFSLIRHSPHDLRWVPCRRPIVVTGGELTLEMLDLRYDNISNLYEAPLHMKALGGCLFIDDFGRQLLSPTHLLNRWIVPLESRMDFLRLQNGKTFRIPFEELLIFSTNLDPEDLMDTAFLRRLPYKIEVPAPSLEHFYGIFEIETAKYGMDFNDQVFDRIVNRITQEKGLELAAYHPRFIVEQVAATCRFLGLPIHLNQRFVDHAIDNLRVRRPDEQSRHFTHARI